MKIKNIIITIFILFLASNAFAGELQYLHPPELNSADQIRIEWEETTGYDIWCPYFLFLNIENYIKNHLKISLWRLKGGPEFNYKQKQVIYRFKLQL